MFKGELLILIFNWIFKNVFIFQKYEKPFYTADSYKGLLRKSKTNFNCKQEYALKELFAWRDRMARNEDESLGYLLNNSFNKIDYIKNQF